MLTLKLITEQTERVVKGLEKKHFPGAKEAIDKVLEIDKRRREAQQKLDANKQQGNQMAKAIGGLMKEGKKDEAEEIKKQVASLKAEEKRLQQEMEEAQGELVATLVTIPNIPNELVPFDYQTYEAFPGHVEAGVTNLETGQAEYKEVTTEDKHFRLLQATCAMPLMFPVFHLDGKPYLDGGAADAVPYRRAFEQGCDRVVVILTKPRSFVRKPERLLPLIQRRYREYPNFCRTMEERPERDNQSRAELFQLEKEGKALVIAPNTLHGVGRIEHNVDKLRMLWAEGYQQGMENMEQIRSFMDR